MTTPDAMDDSLRRYYELLVKWNRQINLTSVDDEAGFRSAHAEDAHALLAHLGTARTMLDLGTGAGIPGLLVKIWRPALEVTLVDATRKKIAFCDEAIRQLRLSGIRAVWGRAEDARMQKELGTFDLVVSRATWELKAFLPLALPYVAAGGRAIAMKGPRWDEELAAAAKVLAGGAFALVGTHPYVLPGGQARCLLVFERI